MGRTVEMSGLTTALAARVGARRPTLALSGLHTTSTDSGRLQRTHSELPGGELAFVSRRATSCSL